MISARILMPVQAPTIHSTWSEKVFKGASGASGRARASMETEPAGALGRGIKAKRRSCTVSGGGDNLDALKPETSY